MAVGREVSVQTMIAEPRALRTVVGEAVRRIRGSADARQEDLAAAAHRRGLTWSRQKVAMLERGSKSVSVEELVILLDILSDVCRRPVGLGELIPPDTHVALSRSVVLTGRDILKICAGHPTPGFGRDGTGDEPLPSQAEWKAARKLGVSARTDAGTDIDRWRALRGRASRALIAEIEKAVDR